MRSKGAAARRSFGSRVMRWATAEEREETINKSAIFVALGFVLILLGVRRRYPVSIVLSFAV